jgi:(p)ppGpp synthase/HD superfamily hydrolase
MYGMAYELAHAYHAGQKRKNGEDYIRHCERVSDAFTDDQMKAIAVLHDTVEDTDLTIQGIESIFGPYVANRVFILTHKKCVSYLDYILAIKQDAKATEVKLADLADNLNGATGTLRDKYLMAQWILEN